MLLGQAGRFTTLQSQRLALGPVGLHGHVALREVVVKVCTLHVLSTVISMPHHEVPLIGFCFVALCFLCCIGTNMALSCPTKDCHSGLSSAMLTASPPGSVAFAASCCCLRWKLQLACVVTSLSGW